MEAHTDARVVSEIQGMYERACVLFEQACTEAAAIKRLQKEIEVRKDRRDSLWDKGLEICSQACTATRIFTGGISTRMTTRAG